MSLLANMAPKFALSSNHNEFVFHDTVYFPYTVDIAEIKSSPLLLCALRFVT